jgi:hypothetical protein
MQIRHFLVLRSLPCEAVVLIWLSQWSSDWCQVLSTPTLYLEDLGINCWTKNLLSWLRFSTAFLFVPGNCHDSTLNQATTVPFDTLSNLKMKKKKVILYTMIVIKPACIHVHTYMHICVHECAYTHTHRLFNCMHYMQIKILGSQNTHTHT